MPTIDIWIQLENHPWDCCPNGKDRMTGAHFSSVGTWNGRAFYKPLGGSTAAKPLGEDALIFRRYTPNWAAPDDRKVNPWDLNEPNPTETGTKGTIPGPVIECNVGDEVVVHFRNMDTRAGKSPKARAHSMHPHGFVFKPTSDGAYPLSPPDPSQPIPAAEQAAWAAVGVTGPNKIGDRVPSGGTFNYTWTTQGWPTTAGVWLYHDHSICDMKNVDLGAIGIIVIHNPADTNNDFLITPADLPGGSLTGSPVSVTCFPFDFDIKVDRVGILPHDLAGLGLRADLTLGPAMPGMPGMPGMPAEPKPKPAAGAPKPTANVGPPVMERLIQRGDLLLEADAKFAFFRRFCISNFRPPPAKAMYLMLFHDLEGAPGMAMNGRVFLGNTPTMVAGTSTKMRFGVVGMGDNAFHTFHMHGHRWIIPGPDGNTPGAIQGSPQVKAVSQFEDTRIFGPANSFGFTIDEAPGSFMRAGSRAADDAKGEWHMHCHVLGHMMSGMMGSLLIIGGGETVGSLPEGEACPPDVAAGTDGAVSIGGLSYSPQNVMINVGQKVVWTNNDGPHTVTSNPGPSGCSPASTEAFSSPLLNSGNTFQHTFNTPGTFAYHCEVHGCSMSGTVTVM